ncbi:MAG: phosphoribosylformylglycinamidine synthase, partial [Clostridia bacterium]|nr:phosphoribosylformylglycinamidine synthase [Clostridia bacterium]
MVYRVYVEKKPGLDNEARALKNDINAFLRIENLEKVRVINRYDVENITEELFDYSIKTVFSEPQLDNTSDKLTAESDATVFAVEYLPGQFDQRADSASQCIQIISQGDRPLVKTAKVYILYGNLSDEQIASIKKYVINPVESREASLDEFTTLKTDYDIPTTVETLDGFCKLEEDGLKDFIKKYGLAMDLGDITFCRDYFRKEQRDPTITEIRMIDTYWSDHCRHTTFLTVIDSVKFSDPLLQSAYDEYLAARNEIGRTKPVCLMDIGTIAAKVLKKRGLLQKLDESEEINACTV